MSKKLPLFTKLLSCLLIVLFLQVFVAFAQSFPPNILAEINSLPQSESAAIIDQFNSLSPEGKQGVIATLQGQTPAQRMALYKQMANMSAAQLDAMNSTIPKGRMVFELNADGEYQKAANKYKGFEIDPAVNAAFREGGVIYSIELVRPCSNDESKYLAHMRVLILDKKKKNILITNQRKKTASIRLEGKVRRWEKDCNDEIREIGGGDGKMTADFSETSFHSSPRTFMVNAKAGEVRPIATGMFSGAGISESLRPYYEAYGAAAPIIPVAGSTGGNEQAAVLDDPAYMAAMIEAAKKQGIKLDVEKLKEMRKMADGVAPTHSVALVSRRMIQGKVPAVLVYVFAGSPAEAISDGGGGDDDDGDDKKKCDYYLALDGLDTNSGTIDEPFATMQKSLDEAKICRDQNKTTTVTVINGIYHQTASVKWKDSVKTPMLTIKGESVGGVTFSATNPPNSVVLPFAIKITGAKNVVIKDITFSNFGTGKTPGLIQTGSQIALQGVTFQ